MQVDDWGRTLLGALLDSDPLLHADPVSDGLAWRQSGAMRLTGRVDGPALGAPPLLVPGVRWLGRAAGIADRLDVLALLGERAACAGLTRAGRTSCGGATRLLDAADGPVAISLARPTDVALLPALLGADRVDGDHWSALERMLPSQSASHWVEQGSLLGMAIAALGEVGRPTIDHPAVRAVDVGPGACIDVANVRVLDLSSLWAGPLCAHILQLHGADVAKAESWARPDGARSGNPLFFDLVNAGKRSVPVDLSTGRGRSALAELINESDVVIEASRPRALEQAGIFAHAALREGRTQVWVAITGYGQSGRARHRPAFGDDAAVAGGLVGWDEGMPVFLADAVADPLTGLTAGASILAALRSDQRWYVDISMARVAAAFAGDAVSTAVLDDAALTDGAAPSPPRHRARRGAAPALVLVAPSRE